VKREKGQFLFTSPVKLFHHTHYPHRKWQKNWVPFEWNREILLGYTLHPHEILLPNLESGESVVSYTSHSQPKWRFGHLRGGTPAQLVDGEYLAFFHSSINLSSSASRGRYVLHYFMGAYTFSSEPPFKITKMTPVPIMADEFYTLSNAEKKVIFPGGFIDEESLIHVVYGKDDNEIWVVTLDKKLLYKKMVPLEEEE
jgi:predicted GH43/DUF377 family glycosyl hydrolase